MAAVNAPFPWFGGKRRVAPAVWARFGNVRNYVEPFFGSGAVLLARPEPFTGTETINDACGFVANFWRAIQADPDAVARWVDWPVNESDLEARHYWLVTEGRARLDAVLGDPTGFDAQVAGWWCWGLCAWIGGGWCADSGPWRWADGAWEKGGGGGVSRRLPHLGNPGRGAHRPNIDLHEWFAALAKRLRRVRVAHGDWSRVTGGSVTWRHGITAVFLDPPYSGAERTANVYATDSGTVAAKARAWAIEEGARPDMRVALCGYAGEHDMPGWSEFAWKATGGYSALGSGRGRDNAARERIWFSPACLSEAEAGLI